MRADAGFDIQKAVFETLKANAALMSKITGVFDSVPEKQKYPYVTIGDDTITPFDTDTSVGSEATLTIHTWSQDAGRSRNKLIMGLIRKCLHRNEFPVEGQRMILLEQEFATTSLDPDGRTYHGVQRFRATLDEEAT